MGGEYVGLAVGVFLVGAADGLEFLAQAVGSAP